MPKVLTREQAAKIIAYLELAGEASRTLLVGSATFTDVAATRWSAGFGLLPRAGRRRRRLRSKFDLAGQLTALQFAG